MNLETIISTVLGVIIGGIITWVVARYYYKKAGDKLIAESNKLILTSGLILYKLQYPNAQTEIIYNDKGNVTGLKVIISAK